MMEYVADRSRGLRRGVVADICPQVAAQLSWLHDRRREVRFDIRAGLHYTSIISKQRNKKRLATLTSPRR